MNKQMDPFQNPKSGHSNNTRLLLKSVAKPLKNTDTKAIWKNMSITKYKQEKLQ